MLSGLNLILFFMVLIVLMIVSIAKLKLHPFLAIMSAALLLALSALPLDKVPLRSARVSPPHFPRWGS